MLNFNSLQDVFAWVIYSGGAMLVVSWILDKIPAFLLLPSDVKKIINIAASAALALFCYLGLVYIPPAVFAAINPYFLIVSGVVILYSGQQVVHRLTKDQ